MTTYHDPSTGRTVTREELEGYRHDTYCPDRSCGSCPLARQNNGCGKYCWFFVAEWPDEAAEIMGLIRVGRGDPKTAGDEAREAAPCTGAVRRAILEKAIACVCGEREQDYGAPEDNFKTIGRLWTAYTGVTFTAKDVAMMMALLKVARIKAGDKADSFVDLAGYAACAGEIVGAEKDGGDGR